MQKTHDQQPFGVDEIGKTDLQVSQVFRAEKLGEGHKYDTLLDPADILHLLETPEHFIALKRIVDEYHAKVRTAVGLATHEPEAEVELSDLGMLTPFEIIIGDTNSPDKAVRYTVCGIDISVPNNPKFLIRQNNVIVPSGQALSVIGTSEKTSPTLADQLFADVIAEHQKNQKGHLVIPIPEDFPLDPNDPRISGLALQPTEDWKMTLRRIPRNASLWGGDLTTLEKGDQKIWYIQKVVENEGQVAPIIQPTSIFDYLVLEKSRLRWAHTRLDLHSGTLMSDTLTDLVEAANKGAKVLVLGSFTDAPNFNRLGFTTAEDSPGIGATISPVDVDHLADEVGRGWADTILVDTMDFILPEDLSVGIKPGFYSEAFDVLVQGGKIILSSVMSVKSEAGSITREGLGGDEQESKHSPLPENVVRSLTSAGFTDITIRRGPVVVTQEESRGLGDKIVVEEFETRQLVVIEGNK